MRVNYKNAMKDMFKRFDEYYKECSKDESLMKTYLQKIHNRNEIEQYLSAQSFCFWKLEKERKVEHLFIKDDSLFKFLGETKVRLSDGFKEFCKLNNGQCYIVHSKTDSFGFRIVFIDDVLTIVTAQGLEDNTNQCNVHWSACPEKRLNDTDAVYPRMAINLLFYMSSFPEKVSMGVPDDYKASSVGSVKNKCIGTSEKIFHSTSSGKSTHFRSGYFRHYPKESSWYKNVAGTTKWIDATVVNGKAKTIKE